MHHVDSFDDLKNSSTAAPDQIRAPFAGQEEAEGNASDWNAIQLPPNSPPPTGPTVTLPPPPAAPLPPPPGPEPPSGPRWGKWIAIGAGALFAGVALRLPQLGVFKTAASSNPSLSHAVSPKSSGPVNPSPSGSAPPSSAPPESSPSTSSSTPIPPAVRGYRDIITGTVGNFISFPARVTGPAGTWTATVMVDTGNGTSSDGISPSFAQQLGLAVTGSTRIDGLTGNPTSVPMYSGFSLVPVGKYVIGTPGPLAVSNAVGFPNTIGGAINLGQATLDHAAQIVEENGQFWFGWNPSGGPTVPGASSSLPPTPSTSPATPPPSSAPNPLPSTSINSPAPPVVSHTPPPEPSAPAPSPSTGPLSALPGTLGVTVTNPPSDWTAQGCEIVNVYPGTTAAQMGLVGRDNRTDPVGDVIQSMVDRSTGASWPIPNCAAFAAAMAATRPGQTIILGYQHRQVFILGRWVAETRVGILGPALGLSGTRYEF